MFQITTSHNQHHIYAGLWMKSVHDQPQPTINENRGQSRSGLASCALERDRMAQSEPNQLYWVGFLLFGPFPEENMFGFS